MTKDGYFVVTAYWWGEEPEMPDCFKDLPAIIKLEECESDPANFHLDVGHGVRVNVNMQRSDALSSTS